MDDSIGDETRCPCGSGDVFDSCCGPILAGTRRAPTAEALMRSRYTAFRVGDVDHLNVSWHPDTRPVDLSIDPEISFIRLIVHDTTGGGPFDTTGRVHFTAVYRTATGERGTQEENSTFTRLDGRWVYVDAT
ncbi:SEC-C domain-containing protein [Corynebacterium sp. P7202]|uniref:YchJ family metal-binding protein n=1 Tax=Corynebacterium pygosceleis TaxID=2800406 RepID=A0A9Q4GHY8_9CORY|nr:YchJ family metal-binding protein [Corynebacterium pygosceleis]MCK7637114.1 SEC-C domain-containing protein [Corynebacterium pygosceleis]MCX7443658.1 YchJ family metal-binding protein [Corynebacterium pygosceleis]MCX7467868.1 YchJ family metal-binding protein [Corynebacterium pygosceleis]